MITFVTLEESNKRDAQWKLDAEIHLLDVKKTLHQDLPGTWEVIEELTSEGGCVRGAIKLETGVCFQVSSVFNDVRLTEFEPKEDEAVIIDGDVLTWGSGKWTNRPGVSPKAFKHLKKNHNALVKRVEELEGRKPIDAVIARGAVPSQYAGLPILKEGFHFSEAHELGLCGVIKVYDSICNQTRMIDVS